MIVNKGRVLLAVSSTSLSLCITSPIQNSRSLIKVISEGTKGPELNIVTKEMLKNILFKPTI